MKIPNIDYPLVKNPMFEQLMKNNKNIKIGSVLRIRLPTDYNIGKNMKKKSTKKPSMKFITDYKPLLPYDPFVKITEEQANRIFSGPLNIKDMITPMKKKINFHKSQKLTHDEVIRREHRITCITMAINACHNNDRQDILATAKEMSTFVETGE